MSSQMKTIATFLTPEDAEVARLALEDEGISTFLEGASTVGMVWYFGNAVGWVKLQVPESDERRAREILAQKITDSGDASLNVPVCPKCGADIPPGFEVCWSCQSPIGGEEDATSGEQAAVLPTRHDQEEDVEEAARGDAIAWRAFSAAVLGLFVCPPLLTIYSGWLLLRLALNDPPLSRKGNRNYYMAMLVDLAVCLLIGLLISRL